MNRRVWLKTAATIVASAGVVRTRSVWGQAPQPPPPTAWGAAVGGLRLGLVYFNAVAMDLLIENVSTAPVTVLSHVNAGDEQLDWYSLSLVPVGGTGAARTIRFIAPRTRSVEVTQVLAPGANVRHSINLDMWTRAAINLAPARVSPGSYSMTASYDTSSQHRYWSGRLSSGSVRGDVQP